MVEVEVTRFQHTHHLNTFGRFAVEGYRRLLNELLDESLQGDDVNTQHTAVHEIRQSIQERVHAEKTLRIERGIRRIQRYVANNPEQPVE